MITRIDLDADDRFCALGPAPCLGRPAAVGKAFERGRVDHIWMCGANSRPIYIEAPNRFEGGMPCLLNAGLGWRWGERQPAGHADPEPATKLTSSRRFVDYPKLAFTPPPRFIDRQRYLGQHASTREQFYSAVAAIARQLGINGRGATCLPRRWNG